jgi:alanine dehydrogenase
MRIGVPRETREGERRVVAGPAEDAALRSGLPLWRGALSHRGIAEKAGLAYTASFAPAASGDSVPS